MGMPPKAPLRSSREIVEFINERIGHIYLRPLMYASSAAAVDDILHYYHELWAELHNCQDSYRIIGMETLSDQDCGAASFSHKFFLDNPDASEASAASYVVAQWEKISRSMGLLPT
ncbi:hypothetical protein SAMN02745216_05182 [Desulfatibacillum alkenivorans DSM 16219]|jgi:hypothetical protein|uniref:Uncharacterized protein n=1 Tax=Desulfatibacillum alkenivorans DSM 16219 TaxID=1121393 RepID=A0A1M7AKV7_9BACT|nr:hypothetical protein [Desulfatibacillum alkenivorans]SHL43285.1 hypothetical protein SAMN02745216_05182 [Desulfatibacillum alkenivorans DSM 16219]